MSEQRDVEVAGEIRLGQFLKLAGLVDTGGDVRELLLDDDADVLVNGARETRRGRQLRSGDVVSLGGVLVRVVDTSA